MTLHWLSRHEPLPSQRRAINDLFPNCVIVQDNRLWSDAEEIRRRFDGQEVVIIAPLTLIMRLLTLGMRPLWAQMDETTGDYAETHLDECVLGPRGRWLRFVEFRRLVGIEMKFEDIKKSALGVASADPEFSEFATKCGALPNADNSRLAGQSRKVCPVCHQNPC